MVKLRHWLPLLFCTSMLMSPENVSIGAPLQPGGVEMPTIVGAMRSAQEAIGNVVPLSQFTGAPPAPARAVPSTTGSTWPLQPNALPLGYPRVVFASLPEQP